MQILILLLLVAALAMLVLGLTTASSTLVVVSIAVSLVAVVAIVRARQHRIARLTAEAAEKRRLAKIEKDKDETTRVLALALSKNRGPAAEADLQAGAAPSRQPAIAEPAGAEPTVVPRHQAVAGAEPTVVPRHQAVAVAAKSAIATETLSTTADPESDVAAAPRADTGTLLASEDSADPVAAGTRPPLTEHGGDPVWVIDGRPRYHSWSCDFIHGRTSESVPLAQAIEDGFTPCSLCDPDTQLAG